MFVRYETPDEHGETRRERNERFSVANPSEFQIPDGGLHLWNWYHDINGMLRRVWDGVCFPIPPSEWSSWKALTGAEISEDDFSALLAMDVAFCRVMNEELKAFHERQADLQRQEMEKAKRGRKR